MMAVTITKTTTAVATMKTMVAMTKTMLTTIRRGDDVKPDQGDGDGVNNECNNFCELNKRVDAS